MRTRIGTTAVGCSPSCARTPWLESGEGFTDEDLPWLYGVVETLRKTGSPSWPKMRAAYGSYGTESEQARLRLR